MKKFEVISNVLEIFDFEKCHKVMKFLNWTWGDNEAPNVQKIILWCSNLLSEAYNMCEESKEPVWISTGGYKASAKIIDGEIKLGLQFIVEEYDEFD